MIRLNLNEGETRQLLDLSNGRSLNIQFGPRGRWLDPADPGSKWAVEELAGLVLLSQLGGNGANARFKSINQALWGYFAENPGGRLGLSAAKVIAARLEVDVNDILAAMNILAHAERAFLRCVYYRESSSGLIEVAEAEVRREMRRMFAEETLDGQEWKEWSTKIYVGWEPVTARQHQDDRARNGVGDGMRYAS